MSKFKLFLSALKASSTAVGSALQNSAEAAKTAGETSLAKDGLIGSMAQFLSGSATGLRLLLSLFGASMMLSLMGYVALLCVIAFKPMDVDSLAIVSHACDQFAIWLDVCFTSMFGTTLFGGIHALISARTESKASKAIRKNAVRESKSKNR